MLKSFLFEIEDFRRKQGQMYELGYVLLFSIFAILSGSNSYRDIHTYMKEYFETLKEKFSLKWKRPPAYSSIRYIIQGISPQSIERAFRKYSSELSENDLDKKRFVAVDGKVLRGSFDNFNDKKAIHILSAFLTEEKIILAHQEVENKTNEIPIAQKLIPELGLENYIFTLDALHCQKKH